MHREKPAGDPDAQLMLLVKAGDHSAFRTLVEKYQKPITNLVWHAMLDRAEAEEVAQEVFVRIYRSAARYQPKAKFSTWLYRIAMNLALNELKRKRRRKTVCLDEALSGAAGATLRTASPVSRPDQELERTELAEALERALRALPERQRIAVVLHRFEGLPYREIAQSMGCSVEAVGALLSRAKISLREALSGHRPLGSG